MTTNDGTNVLNPSWSMRAAMFLLMLLLVCGSSSRSVKAASSSSSSSPEGPNFGPAQRRLHRMVQQEWVRRNGRVSGITSPTATLPSDFHRHLDVDFAMSIHTAAMTISRSVRQSKGHFFTAGTGSVPLLRTVTIPAVFQDTNDDDGDDTHPPRRNNNNNINLTTPTRLFLPATTYGADPTGRSDSTAAFRTMMSDVLSCIDIPCNKMASGITDLGGATIDLEGGQYIISEPLYIPPYYGNLNIMNGALRAATNVDASSSSPSSPSSFPSDRWLIEIGRLDECHPDGDPQASCHEFINLHRLLLDAMSTAAGGIKVDRAMGTTIDTVFVIGFPYVGIQVNDGHEVLITDSWIAEWYWDHHTPGCGSRHSVGIQLNGNDHVITNTIVFHCTKIGIQVFGGANVLIGVHTWNGGGIGIQLGNPHQPATSVRLVDCYLDFNSLDVYSPHSVSVETTFFLQTGINIRSSDPPHNTIDGLVLRGNSYIEWDQRRPNPIEIVDGNFSMVRHVHADEGDFSANRATTVTKSLSLINATTWRLDFTSDLLFPGIIDRVSYSVVADGDDGGDGNHKFFSHVSQPPIVRTNPPLMVIEIITSEPVNATMHVTVEQAV